MGATGGESGVRERTRGYVFGQMAFRQRRNRCANPLVFSLSRGARAVGGENAGGSFVQVCGAPEASGASFVSYSRRSNYAPAD